MLAWLVLHLKAAETSAVLVGWIVLAGAVICLAEASYMLWSSRVGKLRERERILDLAWIHEGDQVLDVGCGRGLLLNACARRLVTGKATGADIWSTHDQSGNGPEATLENARREGVADRVTIVTADARSLPFPDGAFDVVISNIALHNIPDRKGRTQAVLEIARVLRTGGRCALSDLRYAAQYADVLRKVGFSDVRTAGPHLLIFPPVWIALGRKGGAQSLPPESAPQGLEEAGSN